MKYKIVMLACEDSNIIIERNLNYEEAKKLLKKLESEDFIHYYEIEKEN